MGRSWQLGNAFGIGLYLHWTFLLLPLWAFSATGYQFGFEAGAYSVVLLLCVFTCVVLHELGHALTARAFGIQTRDITLYPIGGVARLERMTEQPLEELLIAVAGPAVNVVLALLLLPLGFLLGASMQDLVPMRFVGVGTFLAELGICNVILAVFNMVPAFPMDGGRVLRAALSPALGRMPATEIAAALGTALAGVAFLASAWRTFGGRDNMLMFMFLSFFVMLMGQYELAATRQRERRRGEGEDSGFVDGSALPCRPNFSGFTWDSRQRLWVEWRDGRPINTIPIESD